MATYIQIQKWTKENFGFTVKTCWIAHVKEMCGLEMREAPNRLSQDERANPCPRRKVEPIKKAFRHFGMI